MLGVFVWLICKRILCFSGKILGGGNGDVAADVYHRYKV